MINKKLGKIDNTGERIFPNAVDYAYTAKWSCDCNTVQHCHVNFILTIET